MDEFISSEKLTTNFVAWAKGQGITGREFASKMGFSENHAYMMLRGDQQFTVKHLGPFMLAFGLDAAMDIIGHERFEAEVMDGGSN